MSIVDIARTAGNVQGVVGTVKNFASSLMSFFGGDVVGVFDGDTGQQLFTDARPMKANIGRAVKIMDHPIENGAVISDFAVTLPFAAEMTFVVSTANYAQVTAQFIRYIKARNLVTLQVKVGIIRNMIIEQLTHDETAEVFDAAVLVVRFREVQLIKVQYQQLPASAVAKSTDQSTVNTGTQQPKQSALYQIGSFIKGII